MEKDIDKQQEEEKEQQPYRGKTAKKKLPLLLAGLKKHRKIPPVGRRYHRIQTVIQITVMVRMTTRL